jgi:hypothetical protein
VPPGVRRATPAARPLGLAVLSRAEQAVLDEPSVPPRIGVHRTLGEQAMMNGRWEAPDGGPAFWRMAVRSPGSAGIRIHFTDFDAGPGKVWVHGAGQVEGPYTARGPFGDGQFWSATVFADTVTIEYEPDTADAAEIVPFRVDTISHQAAPSVRQPAGFSILDGVDPAASKDPAAGCHLDPNCYADWRDTMKSVAHLVYEKGGETYMCSGGLLATRDNSVKPYLLTANHCISAEAEARTLEAYWTYQTSGCYGAAPQKKDSSKSTAGASLLVTGPPDQGDFSLLLLKDVPSGVLFAGWDPGDLDIGAPVTGIHHPAGSYKRISFGYRVRDQYVVIEGYQFVPGNYWQVVWENGRTEPGSSGSPLFRGPGVVVGTLSNGLVSPTGDMCDLRFPVDGYGRFSTAYPLISDYLENLPASAVVPAPASLLFRGSNGAITQGSQNVTLTTQAANPVVFKARADATWIKLPVVSGTVSSRAPATLQIGVDPKAFTQAGIYSSTVTILSGAAAPKYINVRVEIRMDRSQVQVTFDPNPVTEQPPDSDGVRWVFSIRLEEKAGAATRLTMFRINGEDFSKSIEYFFGGARLSANGKLEATLRATGPFAGAQYFDFGGVDEASGQTWYQSVAVPFVPLR